MINHKVRTHRSAEDFPQEEHLAYKIAQIAVDPVEVPTETAEMIINRVIDNAAVSAASVTRRPVTTARAQAVSHPWGASGIPSGAGAQVFGVNGSYSPEWAAWANGVAVRELDFHDTFLAAEYSHPGDNIPPLVAVAQHKGVSGHDLIRASRPPTRSRSTSCGASRCTNTRSTTSLIWVRRRPPVSARCLGSTSRRSIRRSARRCT